MPRCDRCRELLESPWCSNIRLGLLIVCLFIVLVHYSTTLPTFRVVAIGDSLIRESQRSYGMLDQISYQIGIVARPYYIQVFNSGVNSDTIGNIRKRLAVDCYAHAPRIVLLYWDSDVSNYDEYEMSNDEIADHRWWYLENLGFVLDRLKEHSEYILVSGPTLMGEKPRGHNYKDRMMEAYLNMNKNASLSRGIDYLDSRSEFYRALPSGWNEDSGFLTEDGEHMNSRGAQLMAELVSKRIKSWLLKPAKPQRLKKKNAHSTNL